MKAQRFVFALYPTTRGYAFVLFEGPESPFDWGVKEVRQSAKNDGILQSVSNLMTDYHPHVLVMEDCSEKMSRRSARIRKLYRALMHLAETEHIDVHLYTRALVKCCFSAVGAATKFEIAQAVARHIPAFKHRLPPLRKIWMSEDPRQSLFDAAALGLTYYSIDGNEDRG